MPGTGLLGAANKRRRFAEDVVPDTDDFGLRSFHSGVHSEIASTNDCSSDPDLDRSQPATAQALAVCAHLVTGSGPGRGRGGHWLHVTYHAAGERHEHAVGKSNGTVEQTVRCVRRLEVGYDGAWDGKMTN